MCTAVKYVHSAMYVPVVYKNVWCGPEKEMDHIRNLVDYVDESSLNLIAGQGWDVLPKLSLHPTFQACI